MDQLAAGVQWLAEQMTANAASPATYRRKGRDVAIVATLGETVRDDTIVDGLDAQQQTVRIVDWIVEPDQLTLDGSPFLPERGDLVIDQAGNRFRVAAPISNEPPFSYTTPHRTQIRIHTVGIK